MIMRTTKKPKFIRQGGKSIKRLEEKWRRPRGKQSKLRRHMRSRGNIPHPGYGTSKKLRGLHPSGLEDILVHNVAELEKLDKNKQAARIASAVGKKKRIDIQKKAEEIGIKILNPKKVELKKPKAKETKKEPKKEEVPKEEEKKGE